MESFVYTSSPSRVIFGPGSRAKVAEELDRQNLTKTLILCTPNQTAKADEIKQLIGSRAIGLFSEATMHTPIEVTTRAVEYAEGLKADSVISIGGGSTIGLSKAISIRTGLPHICIPTTYAGSEMTPILGETSEGVKSTRRDPKLLPDTVIYDVELTMSLPKALSATSGINAIAHAVEALYAPDTNPIINLCAKEGIKSLAEALPIITESQSAAESVLLARSKALYGAWLCGTCLGSTSMSLHHKLCHTLGGSFDLPHAETHTILLPHTMAYNAAATPVAMKAVAESLPESDGDAVHGLNLLLDKLNVPRALSKYGMKEKDIKKGAALAVRNPYSNPRSIEEQPIRELIRRAWAGEPARSDY